MLALFLVATPVYANTTGYAWSESLGWFDFSNAVISDTTVTGYSYNDNTGWLALDGIINTDGELTGYGWSESVGYVDFSSVYIDNGTLKGYAYNDNTGWISFETGTNVTTAWVPAVAPTPEVEERRRSSSGSSKKKVVTSTPTTIPSVNTPSVVPTSTSVPTIIITNLANNPRDLEINTEGEDIRTLQQFLNSRGFIVNTTPGLPGSLGYESVYFGNLTQTALAKFQTFHNILPSAGYFGPKTRAFIGTLITTN